MKLVSESLEELFENVDKFYHSTLNDEYWKNFSDKFPNYNSPGSSDCDKAVNHILGGMKKKYTGKNWKKLEPELKSKIHSGIT